MPTWHGSHPPCPLGSRKLPWGQEAVPASPSAQLLLLWRPAPMQAVCSEPPELWSRSPTLPSSLRSDGLRGQALTLQPPNLQHCTWVQGQEEEGKGTGEERVDFGWVGL